MANFIDPLNRPFEFPRAIINQISECSPEGFMLFYIDSYGKPQIKADFSHQVSEMGLRSFASKILDSINEVEGCDITENIFRRMTGEEEPEN